MKLTIVVPIYNVEKYLNECLDSFVSQTNQNFNVLLIDDGSTDSSSKIAKEYAERYPNLFSYIHQENKGLGGARNTGLKLVDSEYMMFFDSDDFMANRAVENILKFLEEHPERPDIIFFNPVIYDMVTHSYEPWHDKPFIEKIFAGKSFIDAQAAPELMETEASVCRAVWRTEFLKRVPLEFIEHVHWEDVPPHFLLMHKAKLVAFVHFEGLYYYRFNVDGQITSGGGRSRLDMKIIFDAIRPYFESEEWSKKEKAHMLAFLSNYLFWSINVVDDNLLSEFIDISHKFFKDVPLSLIIKFMLCTKVCLRNKLMIYYLKSNRLYKKLSDRDSISNRMKFFKKIKRLFKWKS